jgi:hypothetical protein
MKYDLILHNTEYKVHACVMFMYIEILTNLSFQAVLIFTVNVHVTFFAVMVQSVLLLVSLCFEDSVSCD